VTLNFDLFNRHFRVSISGIFLRTKFQFSVEGQINCQLWEHLLPAGAEAGRVERRQR